MKIFHETKTKIEEFIKEFLNKHSQRSLDDYKEFSKYVYQIIEENSDNNSINKESCVKLVEDFFGTKSTKFINDLIDIIQSNRTEEENEMFEENSSNEIIEEKIDEENEILNSEEESEGKNIFKTKRSNSDQNESDDDEENSDRGHKRRKSSRDNSNEKLVEDKHHNLQNQGIREGNFPKNPNFPKNLPSFGMPMPPFVPMIKGKKKFPMNKNMMKGPFPPMFPFPYPYPGMAFPEYFQSHMWNNTNPPNLNIKPKQTSAEYDPLNPENNKKKRPNPYKDRKIPSETDNKPVITPDNNPELDISEENKQILAENQSKREKKSPTKAKKTIKDTVFIKNIPNYYNTVETLSKFYKKFGSIETINVEQSKLLASVKFMKALDAVKAVNSNKKLFGRDEIFVTLNPDEEIPIKKDNNLNQQTNNKVNNNLQTQQSETKKDEPVKKSNSLLVGKISKLNEMKSKKEKDEMKNMILKKITQKLKFMLFIKSRFGNENSQDKENLINELNKLKNYKDDIVKGKYDETLKTIYDHELSDYSYDFTLIIKNLPDTSLNYANLTSKLQVYGKIDNMKILIKEKSAHVKFAQFEGSENAFFNCNEFIIEYLDKKIEKFARNEQKKDASRKNSQIEENKDKN